MKTYGDTKKDPFFSLGKLPGIFLLALALLMGCTLDQDSPEYIAFDQRAIASCTQKCDELSVKFKTYETIFDISGKPINFRCKCERAKK